MSRLYDAAEPGVIDEELLHQLILEQGPVGEAGRIVQKEGIDFTEVVELRVDFRNIQQIENLWQLKNLCKLRLDNNIISSITGLEQLVNLEWLDLSFNNIREIHGLDKLTKLKDLSLAHNFIKEVGGLTTLYKLQVLSLGHNELSDLHGTVMYLRELPSLQSLCLRGNQFSPVPSHAGEQNNLDKNHHYQMYCLAFIPSLIYLDYQMIMQEARDIALEHHRDMVQEVLMKEKEMKTKEEEDQQNQKKSHLYSVSYIDGLDDDELYHSLFEEDTEAERLALLPGEEDRLKEYCKQVVQISNEIVRIGLEEEEKRRTDRESFYNAHKQALESNQEESVLRIQQYETEKDKLLTEQQVGSLGEKITELHYDVMQLEMQLVDQIDEITKEFERNYTDMMNHFLENVQAQMTHLRELEKDHYEKLLELSSELLEDYSKGQLEDLPDGLRMLFVDKDILLSALNSAHDAHMLVIDNKEDSIRGRAEKDKKALLESITERESARNRQRVTEITQYIDLQHEELEDLLAIANEH